MKESDMEVKQEPGCFKLFGVMISSHRSLVEKPSLLPFKKRPSVRCADDDNHIGNMGSSVVELPAKKRRCGRSFDAEESTKMALVESMKGSPTVCSDHDDHKSLQQDCKDMVLIEDSRPKPTLEFCNSSITSVSEDVVSSLESPARQALKSRRGQFKEKAKADRKLHGKGRSRTLLPLDVVPLNAIPISPPEELSRKIFDMGGTDPNLVIRKLLTTTDRDRNQGRLSMPCKESHLSLTDLEINVLNGRDIKNKPNALIVEVIDPAMCSWTMPLKKWYYASRNKWSYVLCSSWNDLATVNWIKAGSMVEVWSFRIQGKLAFALSADPGASPVFEWGRTSRRGQRTSPSAVVVS